MMRWITCVAVVGVLGIGQLGGCAALLSDRDLVERAPIGKPRESMTWQERGLRDELSRRARGYPSGLRQDALAVLIRRQISARPEGLFSVVGAGDAGGEVELEIAFPREYESQRDVVVVVADHDGELLLAYRPWRWSFSIFQLREDALPLGRARFRARPGAGGTRIDLVLSVYIVEYGHLESAAAAAIFADNSVLVLRRQVSLEV